MRFDNIQEAVSLAGKYVTAVEQRAALAVMAEIEVVIIVRDADVPHHARSTRMIILRSADAERFNAWQKVGLAFLDGQIAMHRDALQKLGVRFDN